MDFVNKGKELREKIIRMVYEAKSGHPGGSLSIVEILMALYYNVLSIDVKDPDYKDRDLFVLSKGHACPALYAMLNDIGFMSDETMLSLRKFDSSLQGHPDHLKTKGVEVNTGSLGQGASVSVGLALALKREGKPKTNLTYDGHDLDRECRRVFTIIGDGESQEGIIWESAMAASHYHLDNLTYILDNNGLQIDGKNDDVMSLGDMVSKFKAFGFETFTVDGHDIDALTEVLSIKTDGKPKFIRAITTKGKGISYMENQVGWHGKAPNDEEFANALKELRG